LSGIGSLSCAPTEVRTSEGCVPTGKQFDEGKQCKGNPIALNTGGKFGAAEDFRTDGPDVLALDRAYLNDRTSWSNGQTRPPMGRGWRRGVDIQATYVGAASATETPLRVTINFPDNRQRMFRFEGSAYVLSYYDDGFALVGRKGDWAQLVKTATALELTENDDTVYVFDFQGRLVQIRWRGGYFQNLSYDATTGLNTAIVDKHGRQLTFAYNGNGLITSVTTPDARVVKYEYAETFDWQSLLAQYGFTTTVADRRHTDWALKTVIYPDDTPATDADNPRVVYHYENTSFPDYLTGMTDERGIRIATYTYGTDGRATVTEGPGGVRRTQLAYGPTAGVVTETNPLLKQAITTFESDGQFRQRLKRVDGQASANCVASNSQYGYDANNWLSSVTDEEGRITAFTNDIRGRRTQIVEAQGTPQARTTGITWNATYNLPDQIVAPGLTTAFTYDTAGRVLTATETDTTTGTVPYSTNGQTRTTTYTYTAAGLVDTIDGPLAGTTDRIDYDYNAAGYVTRIANGLSHITQITALDGAGRPLTVIDPNGVTTNMVYNPRGWPLSITVNPGTGQAVTSFQYTPAGDVSRMTMPDGSTLDYAYDDARRLISITNGANERIETIYDAMDNVTREIRRTPGGTIAVDARRAYDELGRLLKVIGADNRETVSGYDKVGNQTSWRDPRPQTWSFVFDALDRLTRTTEPTTAQTNTSYVPQDEPAQVTDARTNATVYVRNGWGEAIQETSPDRGTIVYIRDVRGLVTQMSDGRGLVTNYTYDGLGRMLTRTFPGVPAETVTWAYDATASGNRGIGRLTSVTDGAGSLSITYNALGQETRHRRTFGSTGYNTDFTYDAAGNVLTVIYPSGRRAIYTRDALGRVTTVTTRPSATGTVSTVVSGITWRPFGPVAGMTFGNSLVASFSYDLDGRLTGIATAGSGANVQGLTYGYDPADNIVSITDALAAARSQTFVYDSVNRITSATGPYGTIGYAYDLVGNRTSRTVSLPSPGTETYTARQFQPPERHLGRPDAQSHLARLRRRGQRQPGCGHRAARHLGLHL
jgi:YD repeat-containing protein